MKNSQRSKTNQEIHSPNQSPCVTPKRVYEREDKHETTDEIQLSEKDVEEETDSMVDSLKSCKSRAENQDQNVCANNTSVEKPFTLKLLQNDQVQGESDNSIQNQGH